MKIHKIEARDLPDLWFQAINDIQDVGTRHIIDRGSFEGQTRLEYDYFIGHIKHPNHGAWTNDILPQIPKELGIPNPVDYEYVYGGDSVSRSYIEYVMTPHLEENESYTYGRRLTEFEVNSTVHSEYFYGDYDSKIIVNDRDIWDSDKIFFSKNNKMCINQIELIIWTYKNKGHRNNQMCMSIEKPDDCLLQDPPCLRNIDTRIQSNLVKEAQNLFSLCHELKIKDYEDYLWEEDDVFRLVSEIRQFIRDKFKNTCDSYRDDVEQKIKKCEAPELSFIVYFRSWDLWAGLPANLAGIVALQEYMASEIGVGIGDMIVESKGLHLYGYAEDLAKIRTMRM